MKPICFFALGLWATLLKAQPQTTWLETLRNLSIELHPEWTDSQLDSVYAMWTQWVTVGAPREAGALCFLSPPQQFQLEIYQSQFGWPHDSTEWRAFPLSSVQREALQTLYHGVRAAPTGRDLHRPIDPSINLGWSCSGCSPSNAHRGLHFSLTSSAASFSAQPWSSPPWRLHSPSDYPVRLWAGPRSVAVGIRPTLLSRHGKFDFNGNNGILASGEFGTCRNSSARWATGASRDSGTHRATGASGSSASSIPASLVRKYVDQVVLGRDTAGIWYGNLSIRSAYVRFNAGVSSRGWVELSGTWYGRGGLLISVQREWITGDYGAFLGLRCVGQRPVTGATPWRPQRGNRATAALPLWAGRLTIQNTTTGPSATWADRSRSVVWYPGQLHIGFRCEVAPWDSNMTIRLRSHVYLGRAQGASIQLRWPSGPLSTEIGIAGITIGESQPNVLEYLLDGNLALVSIKNSASSKPLTRTAALPRATGPMSLWRPGWTAEAALTYTTNRIQMSARIRRSPSGWSGSLRLLRPLQNW